VKPSLRAVGALTVVLLAVLAGLVWFGDRSTTLTESPGSQRTASASVSGASPSFSPRSPSPGPPRSPGPSPSVTSGTDPETGLVWVELAALPPEVRQTLVLVERGGPFPYEKDGAVFGNREGLLPRRPAGFYREYTVVTPGSPDRGARRLVTGDGTRMLFYTADHYSSFQRIRR
jgi:ribonuclease T1